MGRQSIRLRRKNVITEVLLQRRFFIDMYKITAFKCIQNSCIHLVLKLNGEKLKIVNKEFLTLL